MTMEEASSAYKIPLSVLREYESWGLYSEVKKVMGAWKYDDGDAERLGMIMTLHDIGFSRGEIRRYMELLTCGQHTEKERLAMLNEARGHTLDEIHFREKKLERMDYLRHEIAKELNDK
jgi:DNA-binding transcriptional MerR regulator